MVDSADGLTPPVDLDALGRHATSLSGEMERAWSDALKALGLENAESEFGTELRAFLGGLTAAITDSEDQLSQAGIDPKVYTWPGDPDAFRRLVGTSDVRKRREQLEIAQMVSLERFLQMAQALTNPSGESINLMTQARTEWFESGAFSLFRDRAEVLLRLTREIDQLDAELLGEPKPPLLDRSLDASFGSLKSMRRAVLHGDFDAALIHGRAALRGALASLPFVRGDSRHLQSPGRLLAQVPSLSEHAASLELFEDEIDALVDRSADLGVCVLLTEGLLQVIADIVHQPPILEVQAVLEVEAEKP
jgi:hypothetical protein